MKYSYDAQDNVTEELWLDTNEDELDRYQYKYVFDKRMNWLVRVTYRNDLPLTIKEREIEYF